jgi:2-octaprenyl-6-methoxyphenol hydroxylase
MQQDNQDYDVIVVGGGLAGLSLTLMLAASGLKVACLDREKPEQQQRTGFDERTTALAAGTQTMLAECGVWQDLTVDASPIRSIRVTDSGAKHFLHFAEAEVGQPFGWIIRNQTLRTSLHRRVRQSKTATLFGGSEVLTIKAEATAATVTARSRNKSFALRAQLIVGADGRNSFCREQAGIGWHGQDYGHSALVCTIAHSAPHHQTAIEDFQPHGPLACLPMIGQQSSIVWTHQQATAELLQSMPAEDFCQHLSQHLGMMLGEIKLASARAVYPLRLRHAASYMAPRLALVGEAAHVMHPIAGQGLNLSMRDNLCLTQRLTEARGLGLNLGSQILLEDYARARRADNTAMLLATHGFDRIFSNAIGGLKFGRRLGLTLVNRTPPLKQFFMRAAMGHLLLS